MRAKFQVLVIPFILEKRKTLKVALFRRRDGDYWQFIAGGGKENETMLEAAKREAFEEAGISKSNKFYRLETVTMIPKIYFTEHKKTKNLYVIPEYCFAVFVKNKKLALSKEHIRYAWLNYKDASNCLKYDSNKTALWELKEKIKDGLIKI